VQEVRPDQVKYWVWINSDLDDISTGWPDDSDHIASILFQNSKVPLPIQRQQTEMTGIHLVKRFRRRRK